MNAWDRDVYDQYFVRFHDDPGPSQQVMLAEEFYTTDVDGVPGSWCLYNLMYRKVFSAMPISRRADEPKSRRRFREQDEDRQQYI